MFQQVTIVGNLGRDPEMRYTPSGKPVTNFSVATNERWTDTNGEQQERVVWWRVAAWGRMAEVTNQYLAKGSLVMVQGHLSEPKIWTDRDGEAHASLELTASTVKFLNRVERENAPVDADEGLKPTDGNWDDLPF